MPKNQIKKIKSLPILTICFMLISLFFVIAQFINHSREISVSPTIRGIVNSYSGLGSDKLWFNVKEAPVIKDIRKTPLVLIFSDITDLDFIMKLKEFESTIDLMSNKGVLLVNVKKNVNSFEITEESLRTAILKYNIDIPVVNDRDKILHRTFNVDDSNNVVILDAKGIIKLKAEISDTKAIKEALSLIKGRKDNMDIFDIFLEREQSPELLLKFPSKMEYARDVTANNNKPTIFVTDYAYHRILAISLSGEIVFEIGGGGQGDATGSFGKSKFSYPNGLAYWNQKLYIADTMNNKIEVVDLKKSQVTDLKFKKKESGANLWQPFDLELDKKNNRLLISCLGNNKILSYGINSKTLKVLFENEPDSLGNKAVAVDHKGMIYALDIEGNIARYNSKNNKTEVFVLNRTDIKETEVDEGDLKSIGSGQSNKSNETDELAKLIAENGGVKTKPKGDSNNMKLLSIDYVNKPLDIYIDDTGVYIVDTGSNAIKKLEIDDKNRTYSLNLYSKGFTDRDIFYNGVSDIVSVRDKMFVSDTNNNRILILDRNDKNIQTLHIKPSYTSFQNLLDEYLPNLTYVKSIDVRANTDMEIDLNLRDKWSFTENAPNFLHLFRIDLEKHEAVLMKSYSIKDMKDLKITLPELTEGELYYLQGTLYYCNGSPDSPCLIKSYKQKLVPVLEGGTEKIKMNFLY